MVSQRSQAYFAAPEPVLQSRPETAALGFYIRIGGRYDTHIGPAYRPTNQLDFTLLQGPQQLRLQLRRRVAYLVQEEAAALGLGKVSLAGFVGTGKRPASTAKQAGSGQALGNGCHVDADQGTAGAGARPVDRRGHQFLAGTCLAANQHIQVTGRHLLDVLPQMRHVATTPTHPVIADRRHRVRPALLRESQQQHHRVAQQQGHTLVQLGLGQCYFTLQLAPGYPAAAGRGQAAQQHALTIGSQGKRLPTHVGLIQGSRHQFPAAPKSGTAPPEYPGSLARGQGGQ